MVILLLFACLGFMPQVFSHIVELNWNVTWVSASPDGFTRPVVGINNEFPLPAIEVNLGDRLIIHLTNNLGNETTSLHFHGIYQTGTSSMDGPVGVTQCPIPPGQTFTYDFVISQTGTYWYHSHNSGQYIDGLRGPLIVHDPSPPFHYDEDITLTVSDWYHDQAPNLINYFESVENEIANGGAEPVPYSALLQDTQNAKIAVKADKTYMIRIINMGSFAGAYIKLDSHQLTIVEIDGVYTDPQKVDELYITVAQRYTVLITTKDNTKQNFAISVTLDSMMFDSIPSYLNPDVFGWLVYNDKEPLPTPTPLRTYTQFDDTLLVPHDHEGLLDKVDNQIILVMDFDEDQGINRAIVNNITYVGPKVPTLYTALSAPSKYVSNPLIYGVHTNPNVLEYNDVIEIVLINNDNGPHPWHLHGHQFQVIERSPEGTDYDPKAVKAPQIPMRRDTIEVQGFGYVVIRFKADNPGIFLFHCHIEWHVESGLSATMIEAPDKLAEQQSIPHNHLRICEQQGIPTKGNAAANTHDWLDLTGANNQFNTDPWGALINPPTTRRMARRVRRFSA